MTEKEAQTRYAATRALDWMMAHGQRVFGGAGMQVVFDMNRCVHLLHAALNDAPPICHYSGKPCKYTGDACTCLLPGFQGDGPRFPTPPRQVAHSSQAHTATTVNPGVTGPGQMNEENQNG